MNIFQAAGQLPARRSKAVFVYPPCEVAKSFDWSTLVLQLRMPSNGGCQPKTRQRPSRNLSSAAWPWESFFSGFEGHGTALFPREKSHPSDNRNRLQVF